MDLAAHRGARHGRRSPFRSSGARRRGFCIGLKDGVRGWAYVVVRRTPDGRISDVTPAGFNVRTRVHEYGGAKYTVHDGTIYFANFADQRLYRQAGSTPPEPLTSPGYFYADCQFDRWRHRLVCIREDHTNEETVSKTEESLVSR